MGHTIDDAALDALFRQARTHAKWQSTPVTDQTIKDLYDLLKWAPTSANASPARFAFLRSKEAKERLRPALAPLNVEKTMTAPVTVIVAYDLKFYEHLPKLFPHNPGMVKLFESNAEMVEATAKRNSSLQGAYLILAARSLGLDCGPCPASTTRKSTRSFLQRGSPASAAIRNSSPRGTSSRIFSATLVMETRARFTRGCRGCRSRRRARCCSAASPSLKGSCAPATRPRGSRPRRFRWTLRRTDAWRLVTPSCHAAPIT